jgi:hypothetical protein
MDSTIRLWQLPGGKPAHIFKGHRDWVLSVNFFHSGNKLASSGLDTTGVIWEMPAALLKKPMPANLKPAELTQLWEDLASADARKAFQAISSLVAAENQAAAFLAKQLKPTVAPDAQKVAQWIADLDSKDFQTRQKASAALEKLAELVVPQLEKALTNPPSVEMAQRVRKILDAVAAQVPPPERLRERRAVEVLEYIGTAEARSLLQTLSQGAAGATLTREAQAVLLRLGLGGAGQ